MNAIASIRQYNVTLFRSMNSIIGRSAIVDAVFRYFGEFHIAFVVASAAYFVFGGFGPFDKRTAALDFYSLILTICMSFLVVETIRHFYPRPRPFVALGTKQLFSVIKSSTFPSAHTIFIFSLATAICFYATPGAYFMAAFLYLSGIAVGAGRVASGVHFPLDIAGGAVFGTITGIVVEILCRFFF